LLVIPTKEGSVVGAEGKQAKRRRLVLYIFKKNAVYTLK
jgi:hypothetical protein